MVTETRCKRCGGRLAAFSTQDLCPRCMMREAIDLVAERIPRPPARQETGGSVARPPVAEKPGDCIDRYQLRHSIGEGGMGVVYLADQVAPVHRQVALKVIKLGMDTRAVIARFEAERQALALMDHPNIARVFDAGATAAGRPYFVMELVRGTRITDYCEQHQSSLDQRLDLFLQVCRALQHAHQKGIIHRDIKPSNILVALADGVPVPKMIDFGIAKATGNQWLPDQTALTGSAEFFGTPEYMSPEQTNANVRDIDTRTDIYSLGVLLYELLTRRTPFAADELRAVGAEAAWRIIREQEPPKPSTRLTQELALLNRDRTTQGSRKPQSEMDRAAARRRLELKELIPRVRGDLDWIVMKALEKDRTRRYDTVHGVARDIQRYLGNEPIKARPPSKVYRFQKLVRRHQLVVAAGSALAVMLLAGLTNSTWLYLRAKADLQRAVVAEQKATTVARFLEGMLKDLNPAIAPGSHAKILQGILDATVERVAAELTTQPEIEAQMWSLIGKAYYELGDFAESAKMHGEALRVRQAIFGEDHELVAASLNDLGNALTRQGDYPEGQKLKRRALAIRRSRFGNEHAEVASSLTSLAETLTYQKQLPEAEALQRQALAMQRKLLAEGHPDIFSSLNSLARLLRAGGRLDESETTYREAVKAAAGHENLAVSRAMNQLAKVLAENGKLPEAEQACRAALDLRRRLLDLEHASVIDSFHHLVGLLQQQGKFEEVETLLRERLQAIQSQLPAQEPEIIHTLVRYTEALIAAKKFAQAEPLARESLALREKQMPGDWRVFTSRSLLGVALAGQQKYAEAESWLLSGYEGLQQREATLPSYGRLALRSMLQRLAEFYTVLNRTNQAAEWNQKLAAFDQATAEQQAAELRP